MMWLCDVGPPYLLPRLDLSDRAKVQQGSVKHYNTVGLTGVVQ